MIIFHQPRFPGNKGPHFPSKKLPLGGPGRVRSRANLTRTMAAKLHHPRLKMIDDDVFQAGMNLGVWNKVGVASES